MDGRDRDHRLLAGFLAGTLGHAEARRWDEHLLECEQCWRAVREDRAGRQAAGLLRQPAPLGLADRVVFAVEVARTEVPRHVGPGSQARTARPGARLRWLAGAGALAAGLAAALVVVLLPGGRVTGSVPAAVAAVARYARAIPPPARGQSPRVPRQAVPVQVGHPVTVIAGGQRIVVRTWRLGGAEAVVAESVRPFPMPAHAQAVSGAGMAWLSRLGTLGLYCHNGPTSVLVAAPVPAAELALLAARLPLA